MTDSDEDLKRRYRDLAREEPSSALDAAILAKARKKLVSDTSFRRWSVPLSLAAVLMLGIGVTLRMQMEQPGVETSMPEKYSAPREQAAAPPAPAADSLLRTPSGKDEQPEQKRVLRERPASAPRPEPFQFRERADGAVRAEPATDAAAQAGAAPRARAMESKPDAAPILVPAPAQAPATPPPPPAEPSMQAPARPQASMTTQANVMAPPPPAAAAPPSLAGAAVPQRAKGESESDSAAAGGRELRKSKVAADPDPARDLERIAKLREAGEHAEADKALEEFRRRHPQFRIPEAMWERVRPR